MKSKPPSTPLASSISSTPAAETPKTIPFPSPERSPGRPTLLTPELIEKICAAIRTDGVSDTCAGLLCGVSRASTSRWKRDDEDFDTALGQARAQFEQERLRVIRAACKRDGSPDWRAHGWLLQKSSPEKYGSPGRRRAAPKPEKEVVPDDRPDGWVITPEDLVLMQDRRKVTLQSTKEEFLAEQAKEAAAVAAVSELHQATEQPEPEAPPAAVPGRRSGPIIGWGSPGFAYPEPPKSEVTNRSKTLLASRAEAAAVLVTEATAPVSGDVTDRSKIPATSPGVPASTEAPTGSSDQSNRSKTPASRPLTPREIAESKRHIFEAERRREDEIEHWRQITLSIINAPDLYPQSYYDEKALREDPNYIPGMWAGF